MWSAKTDRTTTGYAQLSYDGLLRIWNASGQNVRDFGNALPAADVFVTFEVLEKGIMAIYKMYGTPTWFSVTAN